MFDMDILARLGGSGIALVARAFGFGWFFLLRKSGLFSAVFAEVISISTMPACIFTAYKRMLQAQPNRNTQRSIDSMASQLLKRFYVYMVYILPAEGKQSPRQANGDSFDFFHPFGQKVCCDAIPCWGVQFLSAWSLLTLVAHARQMKDLKVRATHSTRASYIPFKFTMVQATPAITPWKGYKKHLNIFVEQLFAFLFCRQVWSFCDTADKRLSPKFGALKMESLKAKVAEVQKTSQDSVLKTDERPRKDLSEVGTVFLTFGSLALKHQLILIVFSYWCTGYVQRLWVWREIFPLHSRGLLAEACSALSSVMSVMSKDILCFKVLFLLL